MKMKKMLKKMLCCMLAAAMVLPAAVPSTSLAKTGDSLYGDANGDGKIDLLDALAMKQHMEQKEPSGFLAENADVNADAAVDAADLLMLKKYLAEWNIHFGAEYLTVNFYDGNRLIDSLPAEKGRPLGEVPEVGKSSKANAILLGYYTDKDCTKPFYSDNPVMQNMNVYAKYKEMGGTEELNLTSFAQMDQSPALSFDIERKSGNGNPEDAAILTVKDGSDPVDLSIADPDRDGVYTVKAVDGFNEGCSYELSLSEGWVFKGKADTIRTAAFSIAMEEVENLQMSDDIVYIKDTASMDYTVDGKVYAELEADNVTENGGSFVYDKPETLEADDILCIYVGKNPTERNPENGSELLDPAAYVKVKAVNGSQVTFEPLDSEDQTKLYNIPDNFPITVAKLPAAGTGKVNISGLDREMYSMMMGAETGTYENALEKIAVGDFITLYTSEEDITQSSGKNLYFGVITGYDSATGEITYEKTSGEAIEESMALYSNLHISGDDLITEEEKEQLERVLQEQLEQSDFAEEVAPLLTDMVTKTDGFRENRNLKDFQLSDKNGNPLSAEAVRRFNIGGSFELSDDIKLKVELITKGDQLHYGDGVQLAVKIDAGFEAEAADGKVAIDLSATFVEEVAISPKVRGSIVKKKVLLFIPVPIGVEVNAAIDIKNYTAFSFAAEIYTVEEEDKEVWEKIQDITKDPTEVLGLPGIPDGLKDGLKTVGDVMDKIDELKKKVKEAKEDVEKLKGYKEDLEALWSVIEQTGLTTEEEWTQMEEALEKTSIASDLLDLLDMTTDTEISTEYLDSMQALMDKYSEVLEKETDWIELVNKEIMSQEVNYFGLAFGVELNFIIRADMSIAIGSNLEYEVGKRYNFWFKIGLFKPTAGSSSMDLLDERFAFQFYVMGKMGLKSGVRVKLYVGLGTGKFASVGITAELGPYVKLYGFFVYENTKYRPAGTQEWTTKERMAGALDLEFGLYFMLGFEANALGDLFEYSYDFLDEEVPLLTAGEARYYYGSAYEAQEDESVIVRDEDNNSNNGITMKLPDSVLALSYMDLNTGIQGSEALDYSRYQYTVSNPNFKVDPNTGVISVTPPKNARYVECDLTITYLYGKLAFSQYDMSVTVPLVWTNLSTEELSEYYTASVRIGNDMDGYQTVWSKRVLKGQQYNLPTDAEIKEMIGWNDAKYIESTGYGSQPTTGLTSIEDTVYDYKVDYKKYSVTVDGIQNADGTTRTAVYTAKYGESFDFSDLAESGTSKNGTFTKFAGVKTDATIIAGGKEQVIDLTQRIGGKTADALAAGISARAEYVDDGVTATFSFTGITHDDVEQKLKKGTMPSLTEIDAIVNHEELDIIDIFPKVDRVTAPTVYQVICGELIGPAATITFEENGGSEVPDITKAVGGYLGTLPVPAKEGYTFDGWYTDNNTFKHMFEETKMPEGGAVLYAKWTAKTYTVTFHVNGGNELDTGEKTKSVTYDGTYGKLPVPTRSGHGFIGWFTAAEGGTEVTENTKVTVTSNQTLYAHWIQLKVIPETVFDFGEAESEVYQKGTGHDAAYTFNAGGESFKKDSFSFKYKRQGNAEYEEGLPINAGTYDVTVSRPADNVYAKFECTYTAVITINKAVRTLGAVQLKVVEQGYTYVGLQLLGDMEIDDLSDEAVLTYQAKDASGKVLGQSEDRDNYIYNLGVDKDTLEYLSSYYITVKVTDDPNYEDAESTEGVEVSALEEPEGFWDDEGNYDRSWYDSNPDANSYTIETAEQLAGLAAIVNEKWDSFRGVTIRLAADIDLSGHRWIPIGESASVYNTVPFRGIFDGENHKITGIYCNGLYTMRGQDDYGLFGGIDDNAMVQNVKVDDSIIIGQKGVGGIVGDIYKSTVQNVLVDHSVIIGNRYVGGIVGQAEYAGTINNCVNYARVISTYEYAGGIYGGTIYVNVSVRNCVNYGDVSGVECVGGIGGDKGSYNSANYGKVDGTSDVGGIVGCATNICNSFNVGQVSGTGTAYIGAVAGSILENYTAKQCYYLEGSATANGSVRNAIGTKKGSLPDGDDDRGHNNASFTSPTSKLSRTCEAGAENDNLMEALNRWVKRNNESAGETIYAEWVEGGKDGYPILKGLPTR